MYEEDVVPCIGFQFLRVFHSISDSNSPTHFAAWVADGPTATLQPPTTGLRVLSSRAENAGVAAAVPALNLTAVWQWGPQTRFHTTVCLQDGRAEGPRPRGMLPDSTTTALDSTVQWG